MRFYDRAGSPNDVSVVSRRSRHISSHTSFRQNDDHDLEVSQFYEINADHHPIGGLSQVSPNRGALCITNSF